MEIWSEIVKVIGFLILALLVVGIAFLPYAVAIGLYDHRLKKKVWRARQEQKLAGLKQILVLRSQKR